MYGDFDCLAYQLILLQPSHSPIAEPVFRTRILKYVFDSLRNPSSDSICLYKLSVFYLIMSIGSYVEGREGIQTLSTRNIGSNSYYQLARASFSVQGLSRATNTWTVASILLMKYFSYIASDILSSDQQDFSTLLSQTIYRVSHNTVNPKYQVVNDGL